MTTIIAEFHTYNEFRMCIIRHEIISEGACEDSRAMCLNCSFTSSRLGVLLVFPIQEIFYICQVVSVFLTKEVS